MLRQYWVGLKPRREASTVAVQVRVALAWAWTRLEPVTVRLDAIKCDETIKFLLLTFSFYHCLISLSKTGNTCKPILWTVDAFFNSLFIYVIGGQPRFSIITRLTSHVCLICVVVVSCVWPAGCDKMNPFIASDLWHRGNTGVNYLIESLNLNNSSTSIVSMWIKTGKSIMEHLINEKLLADAQQGFVSCRSHSW